MRERRVVKAIILLLTIFFISSAVYAAGLSEDKQPVHLRWKSGVISIAFSTSLIKTNPNIKPDSDLKNALRRSLEAWENAANIKFETNWSDKQTVSPKGNFGDGVSLITIAQTPENLLLFSRDSEEISARTRIFYNKRGIITEADIVLNPYQQFSTDGTFGTFDLQTTLTHEIGHLLGLEHSPVFGATMYAEKGKNGVFNLPSYDGRTLALSDISAVRAIYGTNSEEYCCGVISGKIELKNFKTSKKLIVWAEDAETGQVAGESSMSADGKFSLEGLPAGKYRLFCQNNESDENVLRAEEIGTVDLQKNKTAVISKTVESVSGGASELQLIGFNGQLSEMSVPLNAGKSFTIYIGGKNLNPNSIRIGFNSPNIKILPGSTVTQDFGQEISVVSFTVSIENETRAGEYSLYVDDEKGARSFMIGGLTVEDYVNPYNTYNFSEK